jgi:phosphoribosylaminoimidazole-succinocarboxamide synthase
VVTRTHISGASLFRRGKVRDVYDAGQGRLLIVASDRLSAFDVVLPTPIPDKGRILTQLSNFWFAKTAHIVPNHLLLADAGNLPAPFANRPELEGRAALVKRCERIDIECVARGYLAGSAWAEYAKTATVAQERLPSGMHESERLAEPIFTPATKAITGHDENISRSQLAAMVGRELARRLEDLTLSLYRYAHSFALGRGLILADTKFEFGFDGDVLTLIDEALTPDSSRYWDAASWRPGTAPASFDKQFVRDFLMASGWDREPPAPALPPEVVEGTRQRYAEAYRRLTGLDIA